MNSVNLTGHLGRDPETFEAASGTTVARVSVAVTEWRRGQEKTHWVPLVAFGRTAETLADIGRKGLRVAVTGALDYSRYEDREGRIRTALSVVVHRWEALDRRQRSSAPPADVSTTSTSEWDADPDTTSTSEWEGTPVPETEDSSLPF